MLIKDTSKETKAIAFSPEIYEKLEMLEKEFGLHIDQTGELYSEIVGILEHRIESKNFIEDIMERLEINRDFAEKITLAVNKEIFDVVKNKMRSDMANNQTTSTISSLERAGNFNIEPTMGQNGNGVENGKQDGNWKEVTHADRDAILAGVEDPKNDGADTQNGDAEPLVDYLLQNPIGQREHKVLDHVPDNLPVVETTPIPEYDQSPDNMAMPTPTQKSTSLTPPSTVPNKPVTTPTKSGFDPYKEPIA